MVVETVAGVACFAGDEVPRRRRFGVSGSGRFRLQNKGKRGGKESVAPRGSRSRESWGGEGLYRADADEPRRRSSSSIWSSGGSGDKWVVQEVD